MSKYAALMLLLATAFIASCSGRQQPDSIVLVILDTCRADRVGAMHGDHPVTPFLDAFTDESASFTHAYSHSPWTLPSVASIFTSQIPNHHGAGGRLGEFRSLPAEAVTLAEACREAGLRTAAVTNVQFLSPKYGTVQGFDHLDVYEPESNLDTRRARETTDAALAWLEENGDRPFLILVHYFDPHLVYDPPEPYRSRFAPGSSGKNSKRVFGKFSQIEKMRKGELELSARDYEQLGNLYDGEVSYTDAEFGRLVAGLSELGIASRSVVAVTADHGEEFNDHGSFAHGHTQYDELLHVPLLVRSPGSAAAGTRIPDPVALRDVAPTLCDLVAVAVPESFTGRSLVPALRGEKLAGLPVLSQGNMWGAEQAALRVGAWKVIVETIPGPEPEKVEKNFMLFDLVADPGETRNLAAENPERLAAMRAQLDELLSGRRAAGQAPELSDKDRERLKSLGYVR